jgi:hypothetical protein
MPTNETVVEILQITATGIDEVTARLKVYAAQVEQVESRSKVLAGLLGDPAYQKHAEQISEGNRQYERMLLLARNSATATSILTGGFEKQALAVTALNRAYQLMTGRAGNRVALGDLNSGEAIKHQLERQQIDRQQQLIQGQGQVGALKEDLRSGNHTRHAVASTAIQREHELLSGRGRTAAMAVDLKSGDLVKHSLALQQITRQQDLLQKQGKNSALKQDLGSGNFAAHAKALAEVNRESEKLNKQANLQQLVAEHGKLGGIIRHNAAEYQTLKGAAVGGYQQARGFISGMIGAGLAGSAEGYRLSVSWDRMAKQIAAIAIPAIDMLSRTIGRVAGWFERLNEGTQNWLLKWGTLFMAIGPVIGLLTRVYAIMKSIAVLGLAMGRFGIAGLILGGAVLAGGALSSMGGRGGKRKRTGAESSSGGGESTDEEEGEPSTEGGIGGFSGAKITALGAGYGALRGAMRAVPAGLTRLGAVVKGAGKIAAPLAALSMAYEAGTGGYYTEERRKHPTILGSETLSKASAATAAAGGAFMDFLSFGAYGKAYRKRHPTVPEAGSPGEPESGTPGKRRDVTPLNVGIMDAGGHYQTIQEEVLKFYAAREGAVSHEKNTTDVWNMLKELVDWFKGVGSAPPPRGT